MDFAKLMPLFRRLALEAGDRIMQVYTRPDFEVRAKKCNDPSKHCPPLRGDGDRVVDEVVMEIV